ncbi:multidrug effflux MFS transporter [Eikenella sp. Marseille-P7795]|uniref:multidrug effflux MFS transporter n=1 Tax=Eikenella sp. Marseille-P7795 TaxID=2866577 RepID=UPI001CE48742|nr:multidrug effflux MFS transporter [Eikenella sp. Marseille-P7795]
MNTSSPSHLSDKQMALLLAAMAAVMPFSIDTYLPAVPAMAASLGVRETDIQQSLSIFLVGQSAGVLLGGVWSDFKGRRPVVLAGLGLYLLASFGLIILQTLPQLMLLRMVQAFGAGMVAVSGGAIVRDHYEGRRAAQMFALIGGIMMAAPVLAPMVGWLMQLIGGWRAGVAVLLAYAGVVWLLQWRFLPANRPTARPAGSALWIILTGYRSVFAKPQSLGFLFFQAFSFSSMFVFLTESPSLYMKFYGLSNGFYTLLFGLNIITMVFFNRVTAWRLKSGSNPANILLIGIAVQLAANLLMMLLSQGLARPPLWLLAPLVMLSVGAQGLIVANTQACFMSYFKAEGGSANGVLISSQVLIAAAMGFLATQLHDGSARIMPAMMLASTLCGITLLFTLSRRVWLDKSAH